MKIKKLIKLLECIEGDYNGKLPQDMYHLGTYTKKSGTWEAIAEMDFVHVMRAFKRVINYDENLEVSVSQTNQILKLEEEVSRLRGKLEQKKSTIDALIRENRRRLQENYELRHPRYVFSEIPNDCDGQRFIDDVKKYFNKDTYKMRVRGQHVKEEYKGTGVTAYGQNIEQSTHLRVYIEEKE
tara:strand:- start:291 stop:839 length:549 start_codon:yes stop_codon:yes gene_type:complete